MEFLTNKDTFGYCVLIDPKFEHEKFRPGVENMTTKNVLKFVLSNKNISSALVGAKSIKHIKENIKIAEKDWILSEKER